MGLIKLPPMVAKIGFSESIFSFFWVSYHIIYMIIITIFYERKIYGKEYFSGYFCEKNELMKMKKMVIFGEWNSAQCAHVNLAV